MKLYADEQYPYPVIKCLRDLGHDVLIPKEVGITDLSTDPINAQIPRIDRE